MPNDEARILCLAHDFPLPVDNGTSVRVWSLLQLFATLGSVRLVVRPRSTTTAEERAVVEAAGIELVLGPVARAAPWRGPSLWLRALVRRTPPWYVMWHEPALLELTRQQLPWCTHIVAMEDFAADYLLHLDIPNGKRVVIDKHKVYAHPAAADEARSGMFGRIRRAVRSPLVSGHERRTLAVADAVVVNTETEAELFASSFGRPPDAVIPNGVDARRVWTATPESGDGPQVLWMGTLDNDWNRRGLLRFLEHLRGLHDHGGFRLVIVGRGVDDEIEHAIAGLPARALGFVEDLEPLINASTAAVIPVWAGGGNRAKTLLLLGSGMPVVATSWALHGTNAIDGVHCYVGETVEELVSHLRSLLADPTSAAEMGAQAHQLVASRAWESLLPAFRRILALE